MSFFYYRRMSFLHFFLLLEGVLLALHILYAAAAAVTGTMDGEILILFSLAVAAAESAVGLALYRFLVGGPRPRRGRLPLIRSPSAFGPRPLPWAKALMVPTGPSVPEGDRPKAKGGKAQGGG